MNVVDSLMDLVRGRKQEDGAAAARARSAGSQVYSIVAAARGCPPSSNESPRVTSGYSGKNAALPSPSR